MESIESQETIRVVLCDDHAVVRHGIRQFLVGTNIQVVGEASDGEEAIQQIEHLLPDVAVLDIQMPKFNGIEVAKQIRSKDLPVGMLILSAYDDDPFVIAALEAGVNGYVIKSAEIDEIIEAIRSVHEGKSVLDPEIIPKVMRALTTVRERKELYEPLTNRELEILRAAARGLTNKAIGVSLGISDRTVQGHLRRIFEKLRAANRTEAVVIASQLGLLELPVPSEVIS